MIVTQKITSFITCQSIPFFVYGNGMSVVQGVQLEEDAVRNMLRS